MEGIRTLCCFSEFSWVDSLSTRP